MGVVHILQYSAEERSPANLAQNAGSATPDRPRRRLAPPCDPQCRSLHQFAESLGNAMDAKDHCTHDHSEQVATLAHALALELGLARRVAFAVHIAGHLHDIGKIGVPDCILQKAGPLSDADWVEMRKHPTIGAQIVAPVKALNTASGVAEMILHHHERWDGRGYPHGLIGEAIPLGARILAVADALSAMVQDRPYRRGLAFEDAMAELRRSAGSHLDPDVVTAFLALGARTFHLKPPRCAVEAIENLSRGCLPDPDEATSFAIDPPAGEAGRGGPPS